MPPKRKTTKRTPVKKTFTTPVKKTPETKTPKRRAPISYLLDAATEATEETKSNIKKAASLVAQAGVVAAGAYGVYTAADFQMHNFNTWLKQRGYVNAPNTGAPGTGVQMTYPAVPTDDPAVPSQQTIREVRMADQADVAPRPEGANNPFESIDMPMSDAEQGVKRRRTPIDTTRTAATKRNRVEISRVGPAPRRQNTQANTSIWNTPVGSGGTKRDRGVEISRQGGPAKRR